MFGLPPVPIESAPRPAGTTVYQASTVGALLFGLGLSCLILGIGLAPGLAGSASSLLVIGLPLLVASGMGLVLGYANLHTRIQIGGERLEVVAPSWRGVPLPPLQHLSVELDGVYTIRQRTTRVGFGHRWLRLPFDVYTIETSRGRVVLAGYYLGDLETALVEIVMRAGCLRTDDTEVNVGLGRILLRGAAVLEADGNRPFGGRRMRIDPPR